MELVGEIVRAVLLAGLPVGVFTFALVWWALHKGHFREALEPAALKGEMRAMAKAHKKAGKQERAAQHPVQRKWASFGGGFYGIVAFFTWIVIEVQDLVATVAGFGGFGDFLRGLDAGVIVNMLLETLFNFIAAVTWPVYWLSSIEAGYAWAWFAAAYGGYWLGLRLAQRAHRERKSGGPPE